MQKYNGKFQKQQPQNENRVYIAIGIFTAVVVLFLMAIVIYKMGELSATEAQEAALATEVIQQQTAQEVTQPVEAIPVTEMPTTEPTEVTTAPVETTVAYVEETQATATQAAPTEQTGTVLRSAGELRIRSGAGTNYSEVGRLKGGDPVTIYEQKTVNGMTWGNIGGGWVSMNYIVFGEDTSQAPTVPSQGSYAAPEQNTLSKREICDGYWVSADGLFEMTLATNGDTVDIYITHRLFRDTSVANEWRATGTFDENENIRYSGCIRTDAVYGPDAPVYKDGGGTITIYQSQLEWSDYKEHFGNSTIYYRVGAHTTLPSNSGTGSNSGQSSSGSSSGSSSSGGLTSLVKYPQRFKSKDMQPYMDSIAKIELGYRHGDKYSSNSCSISGYSYYKGTFDVSMSGKWNGKNFRISASFQDDGVTLTLTKIGTISVY